MPFRLIKQMALFGVMGGLLMFFGDLCFYLLPISGADFIRLPVISDMSTQRLILGGAIGPLAGLLYGLGCLVFYLGLRDHDRRLARIITGLFVVMFAVGGAYHAIYTTYGFVPQPDGTGTTDKISALIDSLKNLSLVTGVSASLGFIYLVLRHSTIFPKWILVFTPTFWTLLIVPVAPYIPYPVGSIIIGGWTNLCFIGFFGLCWFLFGRAQRSATLNET